MIDSKVAIHVHQKYSQFCYQNCCFVKKEYEQNHQKGYEDKRESLTTLQLLKYDLNLKM